MGASEAFEGDIEAAARTVLQEAGGRRAKAKELLRRRTNGNGAANGKLNGSEVGYWRQLGALSLLDNTQDALARLRAGRRAGARRMPRRRCWWASCICAPAILPRPRARSAARSSSAAPTARASCAIAATPCWATCTPRARSHDAAMAAYAEAQREVKALLERDAGQCRLQARPVGDLRPHRRHARGERPARCGARELSPEPGDRRGAGQARSAEPGLAARPVGEPRPHRRDPRQEGRPRGGAGRASARGWRSPRPSPRAMATTCSGNGTCR